MLQFGYINLQCIKGEKDKNIKLIRYNCDLMVLVMKEVNKCR